MLFGTRFIWIWGYPKLQLRFATPLQEAKVNCALLQGEWDDIVFYAKQYINLVQDPYSVKFPWCKRKVKHTYLSGTYLVVFHCRMAVWRGVLTAKTYQGWQESISGGRSIWSPSSNWDQMPFPWGVGCYKSCEPVIKWQNIEGFWLSLSTKKVKVNRGVIVNRKLLESDWDSLLHDRDMDNSHCSFSDLDADSHNGEHSESGED